MTRFRRALSIPTAAAYLKAGYLLPPNASDGVHYFSSANTDTNFREEIARVDHQFNEKFTILGHLIYDSAQSGIAHRGLDRQYVSDRWVARKRSFLGCCRASHDEPSVLTC